MTLHAPRGYGKTTLLSQLSWAQQTRARRAIAWLAVTMDEREPMRFLAALSLAVRRVCLDVGERLQLLLLAGSDCTAELAMAVFCNEISQSGQPLTLVVDNAELLGNSSVWSLLDILLGNVADTVQVICASETEIPLKRCESAPLSCLSFGIQDLSFTVDEARELLDLLKPGCVSEHLLHEYHEKLTGWPYGLALIADCHVPEPEETYARLDSRLRDFFGNYCAGVASKPLQVLRASSVPNYFNISLIASLLEVEEEEVATAMGELPFVYREDSGYLRLHQPLRRYLQSSWDDAGEDYHTLLHQRAELWHQDGGNIREAIYHGLYVGDANGILTYLEDVAVEMMLRSELPTLIDWVAQLRRLEFEFSPHHQDLLELIEMWVQAFLFERQLVSERLETMLTRPNNEEIFLTDTAYTTLLTIKTLNCAYSEQIEDSKRFALEILDSGAELSNWSKGILQNIMTYSNILSLNFSRAEKYQEDRAANIDEKNLFVKTYSEALLGHSLVQQAKLEPAGTYLENALDISSRYGGRDCIAAAIAAGYLSEYYYETRDTDRVEEVIWFRLDTIDEGALIDAAYRAYINLARVLAHKEQFVKARELIERGIQLSLSRGWTRMRAACLSEHIRLDLMQDSWLNTSRYLALLIELGETEDLKEPVVRSEVRYYTLIGRALAAQSVAVDATLPASIRQLIEELEDCGAALRAIRLRIVLAHAYLVDAAREKAEKELVETIPLCFSLGCISPLLDCGDRVRNAVLELIGSVDAFSAYRVVIERYQRCEDSASGGSESEEPVSERVDTGNSDTTGLSDKELEVLTLLSSGLSNKDISELLEISVGTVKWHLSNIYRKLDVSSRTEAVFEARVSGLVA